MADELPPIPPVPPPGHPPPPPPPPPRTAATDVFLKTVGLHRDKLLDDLKVLRTHLLLPVKEISGLGWTSDRRLIGIMLLGLFPIAAQTVFNNDPKSVYWCFGFYFSVLWGLFFYYFFQPVGATRKYAIGAFLGTGLISMAILLALLGMGLESIRDPLLSSSNKFVVVAASIFTIGVPEELCKALVILWLLFRGPSVPSLPTMVFYGLMSGLGFGIYEGMNYQMGQNFQTVENADNADQGAAMYYFSNMLRLTTLPFLHAMWTAIGAYFWSLGRVYPKRRYGLWLAALGIPAVLHGLHDSFCDSSPWVSLVVDFISVYALMVYLSSSQKLEQALQEEGVVTPRPTVGQAAVVPPVPAAAAVGAETVA
jgi:RsiW-degrading membrane proteinase PrsW (M82 family)